MKTIELNHSLNLLFYIKMTLRNIAILFSLLVLASCKTTDKVTYFQDITETGHGTLMNDSYNYETKIVPDDDLSILVSSIDPASVAVFNLPVVSVQPSEETTIKSTAAIQTYLVNREGNIEFPVLGRLHVAGLTCDQLAELLKDKISAYAKSPIVSVKIQNFKVSVLGEVNEPGTKTVASERLTVLEAIGAAGDLTIHGERNNVLVIRDVNGKKEFQRLDLTSSDLFASPYYYLQQNDVVYVEPNKARKGNSKYSQSAQFNISLASTIVSAVSVIASLTIALLVK